MASSTTLTRSSGGNGPTSRTSATGSKPQRSTVAIDIKGSSTLAGTGTGAGNSATGGTDEKTKQQQQRGGNNNGGGNGRSEDDDNKRSEARNNRAVLVERTVINEKLVRDAIMEDLASQHDPNFMKDHELDLSEQTTLILSFHNIYAIDNLAGFENLTKLQLDNNIIDKIEHLDHLVNLEWLDLSFNNISKIEGLSRLTKLTDLSLFNNQIEKIEGLETLTNLNVLSLGRNRITSLDCIRDLRRFKHLRLLNLKHNSVCELAAYTHTVLAYLPSLRYLDYMLIDPAQQSKAKDVNLEAMVELEEKERLVEEAMAHDRKEAERKKLLADANLESLDTFFPDLCRDDTEHEKLKRLPGFDTVIAEYRNRFEDHLNTFIREMLATYASKEEERKLFTAVRAQITADMEKKSIDKIQAFEARKKDEFKRYSDSMMAGMPNKTILDKLLNDVKNLGDDLMEYEMLLVSQMDSVLEEFALAYLRLVNANVVTIVKTFRELAVMVKDYLAGLKKQLSLLFERLQREEEAAETKGDKSVGGVSSELKSILADRDQLQTSVQQSHDNHADRIGTKQDQLREREDSMGKKLVEDAKKAEYQRNRMRVAEIHEMSKRYSRLIHEHEAVTGRMANAGGYQ